MLMKYLITFENFNHFWQDLGLSQLPKIPISKEEHNEIKRRKMIYGRDALIDCQKCGARSVLKSNHKCDDSDLPDLELES